MDCLQIAMLFLVTYAAQQLKAAKSRGKWWFLGAVRGILGVWGVLGVVGVRGWESHLESIINGTLTSAPSPPPHTTPMPLAMPQSFRAGPGRGPGSTPRPPCPCCTPAGRDRPTSPHPAHVPGRVSGVLARPSLSGRAILS